MKTATIRTAQTLTTLLWTKIQQFCILLPALLLLAPIHTPKAQAYVYPLDFILEKNIATAGNQLFSVEQDVVFRDDFRELIVRETWLIEGDKNLRLTATGIGPLKDLVKIIAIYNSKTRTTMTGGSRHSVAASADFFERYLSVRALPSFKNYLQELQINNQVRYSRADGAVTFAVGEPSQPPPLSNRQSEQLDRSERFSQDLLAEGVRLQPQIWFHQDLFQLIKMRLPTQAEITFGDYAIVNAKLSYPKSKRVDWGKKSVLIKVKTINDRPKASINQLYPQNLDTPSELNLANQGPLGALIEEFYQRFR